MNKKSTVFILLLALLTIAGIIIWEKTSKISVPKLTEIGAILPLTGAGADYGVMAKRGIELALEQANKDNKQLEVIFDDSKTDPTTAVSILNKLINADNIPAYITFVSGVVMATSPISEKKEVVLVNCLAQSPGIRNLGPYTFSTINDANIETYQMAEYIFKTHKKIGILYSSATYGVSAKDAMVKKYKELGGEIVDIQEFKEGEKNFSTHIEKMKSRNIEAIFAPGVSEDIGYLLKQSFEKNFRPQWYSFTAFEGEDVISIAKIASEGVIYTSTAFNVNSADITKRFAENFKIKYSIEPDLYAATAYDATMLIAEAVKNKKTKGAEIKSYFETMKPYNGITGVISFDKDGCVNKPVIFKTITNGKFANLN